MFEIVPVISMALLFFLMCGLSASVDISLFRSRLRSSRGIIVGIVCQFFILPFVGFGTARLFDLPDVLGITLIAVTCSPGGAYSNWWCSLFNADLALSVAMTACSTILSGAFMPLNLLLYVNMAYGNSMSVDWGKLMFTICLALCAILTGCLLSYKKPRWRNRFSLAGNAAGIGLIVFGVFTSSRKDPIWDKDAKFYVAVALPCVVGLMLAFVLSWFCRLEAPQRIAVTVETCYQNTGIALTLALATFPEADQSAAAGVPIFYGLVEIIVLPLFLLTAWKLGLTYAPPSDLICKVIAGNYQPKATDLGAKPSSDASDVQSDASPALSSRPFDPKASLDSPDLWPEMPDEDIYTVSPESSPTHLLKKAAGPEPFPDIVGFSLQDVDIGPELEKCVELGSDLAKVRV